MQSSPVSMTATPRRSTHTSPEPCHPSSRRQPFPGFPPTADRPSSGRWTRPRETSRASTFRAALLIPSLAALLATPAALAQDPPALAVADRGPISWQSEAPAPSMQVWRAIGEAHGFDLVFDTRLRDTQLRVDFQESTVEQFLDRLAILAGQMWVPLDADTVLVADDTPQNRRQYEPQVVRSFRLENLDVKDAMTTLRSIYGLKHVSAHEDRHTLTLRDVHATGQLVERLLANLDVPEDEVAVRVELVTMAKPRWQSLGSDPRSAQALDRLLSEGHARSVLRSDLGIVGNRPAKVEVRERMTDSPNLLAVEVGIEARVHPSSQEITLDLESELVELGVGPADGTGAGKVSEAKAARSTWRVRSGEVLLVELPGSLGDDRGVLALALQPEIRRVGSRGAARALWIGTESSLRAPGTAAEAGTRNEARIRADESRAESRARLRERLDRQRAALAAAGG